MEKNQSNRSYSRREMLRVLSLGSAAVFFSYDRLRSISNQSPDLAYGALAATLPSCVVRPAQTEGPYFVDEKLNRSDIRSDPADGSVREGAPFTLKLTIDQRLEELQRLYDFAEELRSAGLRKEPLS